MNVLSLFSGIGGLDLGLERAGMTIAGQVEIDPWCRKVLAKHWPEVPRHDDVRTAAGWWGGRHAPDLVAGGFPCQPFSIAGNRRGIADERWMWPAMAAVIRQLRPRYVVVENVPALLADRDAFGWLLGDLADLGFDAEWSLLSACAVGAPHPRERLLLVAYANGIHGQAGLGPGKELGVTGPERRSRPSQPGGPGARSWRDRVDWAVEAACVDDRNAHGSARRMVEAGGNAVVPQVAEHVGRLIMKAAA